MPEKDSAAPFESNRLLQPGGGGFFPEGDKPANTATIGLLWPL